MRRCSSSPGTGLHKRAALRQALCRPPRAGGCWRSSSHRYPLLEKGVQGPRNRRGPASSGHHQRPERAWIFSVPPRPRKKHARRLRLWPKECRPNVARRSGDRLRVVPHRRHAERHSRRRCDQISPCPHNRGSNDRLTITGSRYALRQWLAKRDRPIVHCRNAAKPAQLRPASPVRLPILARPAW